MLKMKPLAYEKHDYNSYQAACSILTLSFSTFQLLKLFIISKFSVNTLVPPTTPRFGSRTAANLTVHPQFADGEIGFEEATVTVTEPENGRAKEINLAVFRDGTLYRAGLLWSIVGLKTSEDLRPTSGKLVFEKGNYNKLNIFGTMQSFYLYYEECYYI